MDESCSTHSMSQEDDDAQYAYDDDEDPLPAGQRRIDCGLRLGSLPLMNIAWGPPLHAHMILSILPEHHLHRGRGFHFPVDSISIPWMRVLVVEGSIVFSLLATPLMFASQIVVMIRYVSSSTTDGQADDGSRAPLPLILWGGAGITLVYVAANLLSLRYIQNTEGRSLKETIAEVCTLSINPNVPPFVRALRSHPCIDYRYVGRLNEVQVRQIAEFFERNTTLAQIRFSEDNQISSASAELLANAVWENVKHNIDVGAPELSTLKRVNTINIIDILSSTEAVLSPDPVRIPLQMLPEEEAKSISMEDISCFEGCPFAATAWKLEDPSVRVMFDSSGIFALTLMRRNAQLLEVDIASNQLTDACVDSLLDLLVACERLQYLDISANYFTYRGIASLADSIATHGRLRSVRVSHVLLDLDYLRRRPALDLSIGAAAFGYGLGIKQLSIDYPSLEEYGLALVRMIASDYSLARDWFRSQPMVIQYHALQRVMKDLGHCDADEPRSLLDLKEEIALARNPPKRIRPAKLYEQLLSRAVLRASDAMIIASCVSNCNTGLTRLSLRGQSIGVQGAVAIIDAVTYVGGVETLDIAFNEISTADEDMQDSVHLPSLEPAAASAASTVVRGSPTGSAVTDALIDALVSTGSLKMIDITGNLAFYQYIDEINRTAHAGGITKVTVR
ncbi:hypothetical protein FOZ61_004614 [Perkinsus olseni]|uniref:RNI-like protein n=1 Tax=Perkinsus olseni TaxID=32597 RepID=A0A7J6LK39_PEROL|nr:hypothetical protein FOZ61_004614 [Perkinsus olseni]